MSFRSKPIGQVYHLGRNKRNDSVIVVTANGDKEVGAMLHRVKSGYKIAKQMESARNSLFTLFKDNGYSDKTAKLKEHIKAVEAANECDTLEATIALIEEAKEDATLQAWYLAAAFDYICEQEAENKPIKPIPRNGDGC